MEGKVSKEEVVSMQGQWTGLYQGQWIGSDDVKVAIVISIEETEKGYHIVAYLWPIDETLPNLVAEVKTEDKSLKQKGTATLYLVDPETLEKSTWEEVKQPHEKIEYPDTVEVELERKLKLKGNTLSISIVYIGSKISCDIEKSDQKADSTIPENVKTWAEYKKIVSDMKISNHLFRGQQQPWKLSTAFHRGERYIISEFLNNDVQQLHNRLSAITKHYFDLDKPKQKGAFINLLQHHGYPTPLLDWSYSPYIAAFFAFRNVPLGYKEEGDKEEGKKVRIYIFNNEAWQSDFSQSSTLDLAIPHLSVMEFSAIDNPRVIPQQAVTIMTNIADIEKSFMLIGNNYQASYLSVIDIAASERDAAMQDLRLMGITAGSMFPDIDGACEEFRERNFKV